MSNVIELINDLCPDGVPFVELENMAEIGTGSSDRKDATEDGQYPFYVRSREVFRIDKYEYDETAIVIPGEGGIGEIFHFVTGKYALHQRAYRIHVIDERLDPKYLYYYMFSQFKAFIVKKAVSATVTSIRKPMIQPSLQLVRNSMIFIEISYLLLMREFNIKSLGKYLILEMD
ncbi:MAG: restriction endonuclease subunit S [Lachnospiraceae bacterium]|nr:restriction endonuclease subunit S [Lachnospiraceae bacterium]